MVEMARPQAHFRKQGSVSWVPNPLCGLGEPPKRHPDSAIILQVSATGFTITVTLGIFTKVNNCHQVASNCNWNLGSGAHIARQLAVQVHGYLS